MGLVTGVLLGPVKLLTWTAEQILGVAETELYDERGITAELTRLYDEYDRGLIDDEMFAATEDELMARFEHARGRGVE